MGHKRDKKNQFCKLEQTGDLCVDVKILGELFEGFLDPDRPDQSQNSEHLSEFKVVEVLVILALGVDHAQNHGLEGEIGEQV